MLIPVLALAGNLAQKKSVPPSPGTFPVNTTLFTVLLVSVILILSALTFFPALSLDRYWSTYCSSLVSFSNRYRIRKGETNCHG